ncbi:hypothetical protein [Bradyrhizobium sp. CCBAU 51627]|uniref:hypothetical protein n=1 Tax=Bradyrhizobium sp. CCBAU 51627 TaxID=1325088 RepID=UPI00230533E2|nr:hypothetical protein [Bradyrhizobium sp. CCBAU 51627]MDA9437259.1 hypothetical protein [Bradyrhizobium sp. CCBAU 51627]
MARNKIQEITVATRNPSGTPGDMGSCEVGFFTVDGDLLTLVEGDGMPVRRANGERVTARLQAGDSAHRIASRLILGARWRGSDAASDFNRPLHYRPTGWV